jgi:hypothetical protein
MAQEFLPLKLRVNQIAVGIVETNGSLTDSLASSRPR